MKRVHIFYSGDVQGVGFRFTAVDVAQKFGVTGWVKNRAGGEVELVAEGEDPTLNRFIEDLNSEMSYYIRDKKVNFEPPTGEFVNFRIQF
jgi:acylphosphatase